MFTVEEIALLCNVSRDFVSKVRAAADSPFCLNKCRPEWFAEWMRQHPDFQLTKDYEPVPDHVTDENPGKRLSGVAASKRTKRLKSSPLSPAGSRT
ncbi:MAG: hypothetical protein LV481_08655 [Methylacidiphilales bacterium]|nr:hypothetical protein [Candidatus Methylacidiphilales bacterium]